MLAAELNARPACGFKRKWDHWVMQTLLRLIAVALLLGCSSTSGEAVPDAGLEAAQAPRRGPAGQGGSAEGADVVPAALGTGGAQGQVGIDAQVWMNPEAGIYSGIRRGDAGAWCDCGYDGLCVMSGDKVVVNCVTYTCGGRDHWSDCLGCDQANPPCKDGGHAD